MFARQHFCGNKWNEYEMKIMISLSETRSRRTDDKMMVMVDYGLVLFIYLTKDSIINRDTLSWAKCVCQSVIFVDMGPHYNHW